MRIGIDIDDTITNSKEYITEIKRNVFPERNPHELLPDAVFVKFMEKFDDSLHKNVTLKSNVHEVFNWMKEKGHKIIFITARGYYSKNAYNNTIEYLAKNDIPYDKLICEAYDKGLVAKENNIDLFIDDKLTNCQSVKEQGIDVIKFRRVDEENNGFFTVDNWLDIKKYIEEVKIGG